MLKIGLGLVVILLGFAACALLLLYVFQRKLLYPAPSGDLPLTLPDSVTKVDFDKGYGLLMLPSVVATSVVATSDTPSDNPAFEPVVTPSSAIIFAHGNGEWAAQWIEGFQPLVDAGMAVMLVEYPGYAGAQGKPSLETMREMMFDAYDYLAARPEIDASTIISHGRSLGGGAACLLADGRPVAALVLESTFGSLQKLVAELRYPSNFLKDKYDNTAIVSSFTKPVFIYHGLQDYFIKVHHAHELHNAASHSELILQDCDHNNCPRPWSELTRFLSAAGVPGIPSIEPPIQKTDSTNSLGAD